MIREFSGFGKNAGLAPEASATVMAMTERHNEPSASGRTMSTGEFRAAPDISASTAQFQAFAEGAGERTRQWEAAAPAPARNPARMTALIVGAIVVIAIIVILVATLG
jgi:hypothetical protein